MKKICFLFMVLMMAAFAGCSETPSVEITNTAVYEDFTLVLGDAEKYTDDTGMNMVRIHASYTNKSAEPSYAACCFAVRAFQHDKELNEYSDVNGEDSELIVEIKDGQTVEVSYCFALEDDSEVQVLVGTPTADMDTIGKQSYFQTPNQASSPR